MGSPTPLPDPTIGGDPEPKPKPIQVNKTDGRVALPVSARVPGTLLPLNGRPRREAPFGRSGGVADDAAALRRKSPPEVQKGRERRRERTCQILCDLWKIGRKFEPVEDGSGRQSQPSSRRARVHRAGDQGDGVQVHDEAAAEGLVGVGRAGEDSGGSSGLGDCDGGKRSANSYFSFLSSSNDAHDFFTL